MTFTNIYKENSNFLKLRNPEGENMLLIEDKRYYVYIYLNPLKPGNFNYENYHFDFEPFYVGKGCGNRIISHLKEAQKYNQIEEESIDLDTEKYCNKHKINTIKKILRNNLEPIIFKIKENEIEQNSCELEKYLIKIIGRSDKKLGPLTNLTDGGEGSLNLSEEIKKKGIKKMKETTGSDEWKNTKGKEGARKRSIILKEGYKTGRIKPPSVKGQTKETHEGIKKGSEKMKETINSEQWKNTKGKEKNKKHSESLIKNGSCKGEKNGTFGTHFEWYTNGKENRRGVPENLEELLQKGFWKGLTSEKNEITFKHRSEALRNTKLNKGKYHARSKKVINLNTRKIFETITDARKYYDIHNQSINDCCMGRIETCAKGFHWEYYNE